MAKDQKPKTTAWNLRPFPEEIKRECSSRAAKEGKADWKWLADYLRKVLPIVETSQAQDSVRDEGKTNSRPSLNESDQG